MTRLLLTGLPATGKTCFGNYLRDRRDFRHVDLEATGELRKYLSPQIGLIETSVNELLHANRHVVISWGFIADPACGQLDAVLRLKNLGFRWLWFDGDRQAALASYSKRGSDRRAWDIQLGRIVKFIDPLIDSLGAEVIKRVDLAGEYVDDDTLFNLLKLG